MTRDELQTQRTLAAINIRGQGYSEAQAERMAKLFYPSPQAAGLAAARAAKAAKRHAASKTVGAGSTSVDTVIESSGAGRMSQQTTHPRARRSSSASRTANLQRWARVRALGLRTLKELADYDKGRVAQPA